MSEDCIKIKVECGKCGEPYTVGASYFDAEGEVVFMLEPHECEPPKED